MPNSQSVFYVILTFTLMTSVHCFSSKDIQDVRTLLFSTEKYNKNIRPSTDYGKTTDVSVEFYLISINEINEVKQQMTTTGYLDLSWQDDYLKWNPELYNDVPFMFLPQTEIWRPDLTLQNGFTKLKDLGDDSLLTLVNSDGFVNWKPYEVFESKCKLDTWHFPFDIQTCSLEFGAWMSVNTEVDVKLGSKGIVTSDYMKNDEWTIISTNASKTQTSAAGIKVIFTIELKRNPGYYVLNIVALILFLSFLLPFTFVIHVNCSAKMGYVMTVFLSFTVFLTVVNSSLPVSSNLSILNIYLIFMLSIATLITMITGLELRLHHGNPRRQVPNVLCKIVHLKNKIKCRIVNNGEQRNSVSNPNDLSTIGYKSFETGSDIECETSADNTGKEKYTGDTMLTSDELRRSAKCQITWSDVTKTIDFFCFGIFLSLVFIVTIVMLTTSASTFY